MLQGSELQGSRKVVNVAGTIPEGGRLIAIHLLSRFLYRMLIAMPFDICSVGFCIGG